MKLNENTNVAMPNQKYGWYNNSSSYGYFCIHRVLSARLNKLETSRELMNADLLKASEQTTVDKEQFLLLLYTKL